MIERLLPPTVVVVETREELLDVVLFAQEELMVSQAVDKRRREFVTGRACARQALERLGLPITAIASGEHHEPLWPPGIVGSITHCTGYRACALARATHISGLGIDAEVNKPLAPGVLQRVAFGREQDLAADVSAGGPVWLDMLIFSAKEAVYKTWFPLTRRSLRFEDVELSLDLAAHTFRAALRVPGPTVDDVTLTELHGRWGLNDDVICTAVAIPRRAAG